MRRRFPRLTITLNRNGEAVDEGVGANVLDGPIQALAHLVEVLGRDPHNPPLRAGEMVTTGTLTRAFPVMRGERWSTRIEGVDLPGLRSRSADTPSSTFSARWVARSRALARCAHCQILRERQPEQFGEFAGGAVFRVDAAPCSAANSWRGTSYEAANWRLPVATTVPFRIGERVACRHGHRRAAVGSFSSSIWMLADASLIDRTDERQRVARLGRLGLRRH